MKNYSVRLTLFFFALFISAKGISQIQDSSSFYLNEAKKIYKNDLYKSASLIQKAETFLERFPNDSLKGLACKVRGSISYIRGDYAESLKYNQQALYIFQKTDDKQNQALAYNGLGLVQQALGRHQQAVDYFNQARDVQIKENPAFSLNAGMSYFYLGDYKKARELYLETKSNLTDINNHIYLNTLSRLAELDYVEGKLNLAETKYLQVLNNPSVTNYERIFVLHGLAEVYAKQNKIDLAIGTAEQAKRESSALQATWDLKRNTKLLAKLYQKTKNLPKALENLTLHSQLSDSLYNKEQAQIVGLLELDLKEKENQLLQEKNKASQNQIKSRNSLLIIGGLFLLLTLFFMFKYRKIGKQRARLITELNRKNKHLKEIDENKNVLFSIVSHDIRSPIAAMTQLMDDTVLSSLSSNEKEEAFKEIRLQLTQTSRMLNNLLVWANSQINGQIKSTFEPLDIQKEMTDVLSVYKIPAKYKEVHLIHNCIEQKPIVKIQVAQLHVILHNILTNALKYTDKKGRIIINYDTSDKDKITLSILNEGEEMHQDLIDSIQNINHLEPVNVKPSANSFGLGLKLVKKYVLENNGSLEIIPHSFTGTEIKLTFSLEIN